MSQQGQFVDDVNELYVHLGRVSILNICEKTLCGGKRSEDPDFVLKDKPIGSFCITKHGP